MYGQNNFLSSLGGGQGQSSLGDLENNLSQEEKRMLQETQEREIEKEKQQQCGIPPMGGRGMY